jgi:hypothetical protein
VLVTERPDFIVLVVNIAAIFLLACRLRIQF